MSAPMSRLLFPMATLALLFNAGGALGQMGSEHAYVDVTNTYVPLDPGLHALDAAFVDVDNDGDRDVVLAVEGGANRLYLNDGIGRLTWKRDALSNIRHDSEHVKVADFNGDGFQDLIFVAELDRTHQLYFGSADGSFADMSDRLPAESEGNALALGDVNRDGLIDIVIGNTDEELLGSNGNETHNFLWLNDAQRPGYFVDATATHLPRDSEGTQGLALADLDEDGDLDLVVANQDPPNRLLINDGSGRFSDESDRLELLVPMETREVHVFDANGDALPDILFFNLTSNNQGWDKDPQTRLLINNGQGKFLDETDSRLPSHRFSSWGGTITDFNQDGAPDIIVSAIQVPGFVPLQVRAWQNDGSGEFTDVTLDIIPGETVGRSWSMATGDMDGDDKDDLFIGQWGTQARLLLTNRSVLQLPGIPQLGVPE